MRMRNALLGILLAASAAVAGAQAPTTTSTQVTSVRAAAPAGFRADYVAEVDDVGKKLIDLAQAMPADKYGWRPAPGVRSVGEVFVHVAQGNSMLPSLIGFSKMEGVSRDSEKSVTDKATIVELLKKSIENAKAAGNRVPDADLEKKVNFFGSEITERRLLIHLLEHMHEHLGQSIAYARMNGVTPPWSKPSP
jgi:uncharacterized damage-inducible protein DinB